MVETIRFGLYKDGVLLGRAGIRMKTTRAGDVVYRIKKGERNKGYGKLILKLIKEEAKKLGREKLILVCRKSNLASKKIIEANGGIFIKEIEIKNRENRLVYEIDLMISFKHETGE